MREGVMRLSDYPSELTYIRHQVAARHADLTSAQSVGRRILMARKARAYLASDGQRLLADVFGPNGSDEALGVLVSALASASLIEPVRFAGECFGGDGGE
jgi:hypothetical protein